MECSLCFSAFVDPRVLPCGHTFCLQCITTQVANSSTTQSSVLCSMCRQVCTLPDGDAGKLFKNFALATVISEAKKNTSSTTSAAVVDAKFMCKTHTDQKMEVYCKDCRVLACAKCGLKLHSKHTFIEIDETDKEFRKVINAAAEQSKKTIETHCQKIADYEGKLREEQAQLDTEKSRLAQYEGLLNGSVSSDVEREAAVKTLQPSQQLPPNRQQPRIRTTKDLANDLQRRQEIPSTSFDLDLDELRDLMERSNFPRLNEPNSLIIKGTQRDC